GSELLGRVAYSIPRLGYMVDFSKRTEGKTLFIARPGLLLAGDYLRARLRRRDRRPTRVGQVATSTPIDLVPAPIAEAGIAAATTPDAARVQGLLAGGRRALDAGYLELA